MEDMKETVSGMLNDLADKMGYGEMDEGDYRDEQGLIVCGKCGEHKQSIIDLTNTILKDRGKMVVRSRCKCQREEDERRKKEEEYREKLERISRIRSVSLLDDKYREARFKGYSENQNNGKALQTAKKYVDNFSDMLSENQGLIFYGPVGTGKSFTAACIANELMDRCIPVVLTSFVKILQKIQTGEEERILKTLNDAKLLILDDLGTERNTDYALEKVYNIVDSRSRTALPMILTTNLDLQEMMSTPDIRYRRIYDRIFETCYPVNIPGESVRRQTAAQRFDRMQKLMEG